ncbi:MAG: adenosylcobinamide-GDP ribazoletransferase [Nitrospirae bacterium]|nr:MAG: adenosylcobinamide-GDP ribazoletransferase [Nitrospirota bacterium]
MYFRTLKIAMTFLTILPIKVNGEIGGADMGRAGSLFPLVGMVQGVLLAVPLLAFKSLVSPTLLASLIIALSVMINGGFHLDGLSDTFDALASRRDREGMLRIMKDGSSGPVGVVSVVLVLILKVVGLGDIISGSGGFTGASTILLLSVTGKWAMLVSFRQGRQAKPEGLGYTIISNYSAEDHRRGIIIAGAIFLLITLLTPLGLAPVIVSLLVVYVVTRWLIKLFERAFGGLTGDTLGAVSEVSEVVLIVTLSMILK